MGFMHRRRIHTNSHTNDRSQSLAQDVILVQMCEFNEDQGKAQADAVFGIG